MTWRNGMATSVRKPQERKVGVHVSIDLELLGKLDEVALRLSMSRSELLRHMIEEWTEQVDDEKWLAEKAQDALAEERVPWDEAKAELGL